MCDAVKHMHERRMMHRDLKPSNIFLASDGCLKLGDLGLSRREGRRGSEWHGRRDRGKVVVWPEASFDPLDMVYLSQLRILAHAHIARSCASGTSAAGRSKRSARLGRLITCPQVRISGGGSRVRDVRYMSSSSLQPSEASI